jgi:hypothetical protein
MTNKRIILPKFWHKGKSLGPFPEFLFQSNREIYLDATLTPTLSRKRERGND